MWFDTMAYIHTMITSLLISHYTLFWMITMCLEKSYL
jgi:hypothetical protein